MTFVDQAARGVMTGVYAGVGTAGFSEYDYPGLYGYDDFHHCGLTDGDDIQVWDRPRYRPANGSTWPISTLARRRCRRASPRFSTTSSVSAWPASAQIAFGRGDLGFVVINREDAPLNETLQTGLASGEYGNVIEGEWTEDGQGYTGSSVSVGDDGTATVSVASMRALAIHTGARVGREGR